MATSLSVPLLAGSAAASVQSSGTQPGKLHKAAQEFEALLVGQMLKSAREDGSEGWLGSGGSTGDDSAMEMAEAQLANALTASGGLGLASTIERSMSRATAQKSADTPAGSNSSPKFPLKFP